VFLHSKLLHAIAIAVGFKMFINPWEQEIVIIQSTTNLDLSSVVLWLLLPSSSMSLTSGNDFLFLLKICLVESRCGSYWKIGAKKNLHCLNYNTFNS
jgi:hypothetical protein